MRLALPVNYALYKAFHMVESPFTLSASDRRAKSRDGASYALADICVARKGLQAAEKPSRAETRAAQARNGLATAPSHAPSKEPLGPIAVMARTMLRV
ncbi:hypothetical protein AWB81_03824 [Caballeronia arationis]|jgi:hypothetical protein|uniref:Uncharacterized protein n=1 Tax=Caballeronia arationis TaxID=1777142 RepID=A0A7Z7I3U0_9BURK|nr:hypothetical protein AWB81_03824 [Caballeronia arationis]SOE59987.1 hypothetical protein SAMN05446927_1857 [Caballeronia arationis]